MVIIYQSKLLCLDQELCFFLSVRSSLIAHGNDAVLQTTCYLECNCLKGLKPPIRNESLWQTEALSSVVTNHSRWLYRHYNINLVYNPWHCLIFYIGQIRHGQHLKISTCILTWRYICLFPYTAYANLQMYHTKNLIYT
jgi:hypothetical protein